MSFPTTMTFVPTSPAVSRIGRFYITRELGRGTMGCIYLGHDPVLGRDIAIKTFNPRLTLSERAKFEQQFINEARAAGALSHPHIVTIYDASIENNAPHIAMEYLQGRGLNKLLDRGHRYKPNEVASIVCKIADALDHAHRRQVIHRDIKPGNIFMVQVDQPKLIDFGIARAPNRIAIRVSSEEAQYTLHQQDMLLGTPNYMSPEQALGNDVDARTDIYSLGAVMYEMLVGRKPFQSDNPDKLLQLVAYKAPRAPSEIEPSIPIMLSDIVMKAMNKRPERRYQTAEAMMHDLKRYLRRERRAQRRMKIPIPTLERNKPSPPSLASRRVLHWMAYLACAAVAAGAVLMRLK